MKAPLPVQETILAALPGLRIYALSLCHRRDEADDLVQETMLRALGHINSFQPGTNVVAWLGTILRNHFVNEHRKRRREVEDGDGSYAKSFASRSDEETWITIHDLRKALGRLSTEQCDAVILVCGSGFSYKEAATICGCPVGTLKSRVSRARADLATLM